FPEGGETSRAPTLSARLAEVDMSRTQGPPPGPPDAGSGGGLFPLVSPEPPAVDPVCGMTVDPAHAPASLAHEGHTYYFCCPHCRDKFQAAPRRYLAGGPAPLPTLPPAGTLYTCPMHPEVRLDTPAVCPQCGMALEPVDKLFPETRQEY